MSETLQTDFYSDEPMQCPAEWYGGYKEPRLLHAGDAERPLSDPVSGELQPATFKFRLDDFDSKFREEIADPENRYWRDQLTHQMTSRENRRQLGRAFDTFCGFIADAQPAGPLAWDITLVDALTRSIMSEEFKIPWRQIGHGFVHLLDHVSEQLDLAQAEPIIYGRHTRTDPTVEPSPPAAFAFPPIYMGIETVNGTQYYVWMVADSAVKSLAIQVDGVDTPEGGDWLIATQANWLAEFGTPYIDKPAALLGVDRRYSLIYGRFGADDPDACAQGEKQLLALVEGREDEGDGSGDLITDYYQQYKHFVVNHIANQGHNSYMAGAWLESPTTFRDDYEIPVVDEDSFDTASTVAAERRTGGIEGAAAIGINGPGQAGRQILANWNVSGFVRFGQPQRFQMGLVTLHPTQAAKDAATLYTDAYEILKGSFSTSIEWQTHKLVIDYRGDYRHETGVHVTVDFVWNEEEANHWRQDLRLKRDYPYLPGRTQIAHLAGLELLTLLRPPRMIRLDQTIGDTEDDNWLAYKNSGDYVKVLHFDAVGGRSERLHQIITPIIRASARRAAAIALDCEDLIAFDVPAEDAS